MRIAAGIIFIVAALATIHSGMMGLFHVGQWVHKSATASYYIDPQWNWVIETTLYAMAFLVCGCISLITAARKFRRG
jgi:hypothetical protein